VDPHRFNADADPYLAFFPIVDPDLCGSRCGSGSTTLSKGFGFMFGIYGCGSSLFFSLQI
jgi:hypothetical protein